MWLAAALSKKDCELACDEGALLRLGEKERFAYGRTLLSVAEQNIKGRQLFGAEANMAQSKKELTARIKAIAQKKKCPVAVLLLLAMLVSLTAVCAFTGSALESPTEPPAELNLVQPAVTAPSTPPSQPQITRPEPQTAPAETQIGPTDAPTAAPEIETAETRPQTTHTESSGYEQSPEIPSGAKFFGSYTLKVGETLTTSVSLSRPTNVLVNSPAIARVQLENTTGNYYPGKNYLFSATAYKVGTTEVYFSDIFGDYLAFVIHVVENDGRDEIGFAEKAEETPSFVLPEFDIP